MGDAGPDKRSGPLWGKRTDCPTNEVVDAGAAPAWSCAESSTPHCCQVTIIVVMSETLPLAEIKAHLSEVVDRVEQQHERVVLTRNGRPAAVIMSPDDLEALEDTLELLSDPHALAEIARSREDAKKGRVVSADQLRAKYVKK